MLLLPRPLLTRWSARPLSPPPAPHGIAPVRGWGLAWSFVLRHRYSGDPWGRGEQLGTCDLETSPGDLAHPSLHTGVPLAQQGRDHWQVSRGVALLVAQGLERTGGDSMVISAHFIPGYSQVQAKAKMWYVCTCGTVWHSTEQCDSGRWFYSQSSLIIETHARFSSFVCWLCHYKRFLILLEARSLPCILENSPQSILSHNVPEGWRTGSCVCVSFPIF